MPFSLLTAFSATLSVRNKHDGKRHRDGLLTVIDTSSRPGNGLLVDSLEWHIRQSWIHFPSRIHFMTLKSHYINRLLFVLDELNNIISLIFIMFTKFKVIFFFFFLTIAFEILTCNRIFWDIFMKRMRVSKMELYIIWPFGKYKRSVNTIRLKFCIESVETDTTTIYTYNDGMIPHSDVHFSLNEHRPSALSISEVYNNNKKNNKWDFFFYTDIDLIFINTYLTKHNKKKKYEKIINIVI